MTPFYRFACLPLSRLALVQVTFDNQHGIHPRRLASLKPDLGIFKYQTVGGIGAEQLGHPQKGVGMRFVVGDIIGAHHHRDIGIESGALEDGLRLIAR